jgi:hypothetical protein
MGTRATWGATSRTQAAALSLGDGGKARPLSRAPGNYARDDGNGEIFTLPVMSAPVVPLCRFHWMVLPVRGAGAYP